jgi:FkbM family methyltransferase
MRNNMLLERAGRFLGYTAKAVTGIGVVPTCMWIVGTTQSKFKIGRPRFLHLRPRFLQHALTLRATTSDPFIFRQIMIEKEYLPLAVVQASTVLDLGANVGLASAWFLGCYPDAAVFSVEADAHNYAMCSENLAPYGSRVRVLHAAAWSSDMALTLCRNINAADNFVRGVSSADTGQMQVQGYGIASLIAMSGFSHIDILKIDVEGAELEIFSADPGRWLPLVRNLCIELHGEACREVFFKAMAACDFEHTISGELDICTNIRPKVTN